MKPSAPGSANSHPLVRFLVRFLAITGAVFCLVITILIWRSTSAQQEMWPLPGVYFLELIGLGVLGAVAFFIGDPRGTFVTWAAVGIFLAFAYLGAMSVGLYYFPLALIFGLAAIIADVRDKQRIPARLAVCILAGLAQGAWMLAAIRLI